VNDSLILWRFLFAQESVAYKVSTFVWVALSHVTPDHPPRQGSETPVCSHSISKLVAPQSRAKLFKVKPSNVNTEVSLSEKKAQFQGFLSWCAYNDKRWSRIESEFQTCTLVSSLCCNRRSFQGRDAHHDEPAPP
jgi:hypothetical protein